VNAIKEIASITGVFKTNLIAWLGDAANGIGRIRTHELCVDDVCVTREQFIAMAAASQTPAPPAATSASTANTPQAPIIELNGNASSTIDVGSSYNDLGTRIIAPQSDINLGIITVLDGATTTAVSIDTSTPGTHAILYTVTDPQGVSGSATRTVIVSPVMQPPATSTPANDNASSTDQATVL
jgi:hypothetical protein